MEKKWTPGPWDVLPANNYHGFAIAPRGTLPTMASCERFGENIAVHCFNWPGSTEANAHLISAAPELYEALLLVENVKELPIRDRDIIKAALAKARGEQ